MTESQHMNPKLIRAYRFLQEFAKQRKSCVLFSQEEFNEWVEEEFTNEKLLFDWIQLVEDKRIPDSDVDYLLISPINKWKCMKYE